MERYKTKLDTFIVKKIPNKIELQQIALNDLSLTEFNDFTKLSKGCAKNHVHF